MLGECDKDEEEDEDGEEDEDEEQEDQTTDGQRIRDSGAEVQTRDREARLVTEDESGNGPAPGSIEDTIGALPFLAPEANEGISWAGFNGRCNKLADTCYSFWNGAALMVCL